MSLSPIQQRALARRARIYVQCGNPGNSVTDAAARCGISRVHYYRLVHDLEAFEDSNPTENRREVKILCDAAGRAAKAILPADATKTDINNLATKLMLSDDFYGQEHPTAVNDSLLD